MAIPASETSSVVIDERRAQQLMERALTLAERGDQQAAVLACRQAVSLAPESAQAYSMLGLLLERSGDAGGAIAAYEKVLQFAPDSLLERESLSRLRAGVIQRRTVHEPLRNGPDRNGHGAATGAVVPSADAVAASAPAATPATLPAMPLSATMPMPGLGSPGGAPSASSSASWQKLRQRPSAYFLVAPLAATTALSLVFLLWAQSYSASRRLAQLPAAGAIVAAPTESPIFAPDPPSANPANASDAARAPGANSPVPTNPGTAPAAGSAAAGATVRAAAPPESTPAASAANSGATTSAPRTSAPRAGAASTPAQRRDEDGGRLTTPPAPLPASPQVAANQGTGQGGAQPGAGGNEAGGASTRGGPLGPSSSPGRSFVRVTPSGTSPVARPENRAANDERAAGNEAQSGRPSAAIERISQAIESGGPDVALRFQQRAQLYLESGDPARAISDFQAAIGGYNEMLARGDRVAIARSGIASCRRGIQIAQARLQQ